MLLPSSNPYYIGVYHSARWFTYLFARVEICGLENIPAGGCIIACNHQSFFDPPVVGSAVEKEIFFLARKTLFKHFPLKQVLPRCQVIPVDRDGGSDITAFKRVFSALKNGSALLMFPEGTRSKDGNLQEAQAGIGLMACKTQVPVVPVRVFGAHSVLPRGSGIPRPGARVSIVVEKPMAPASFDPGAKSPHRFLEASRKIMQRISEISELPDALF